MNLALMHYPHATLLPQGVARRLPAAQHERWIEVLGGELWLTTDGHDDRPGEDVWIGTGEGWLLPAGASVVLQGEPEARFQVVEAAPQLISAATAGAWLPALRQWAARHGWLRPAADPCPAC
jgi:hypothetical protein